MKFIKLIIVFLLTSSNMLGNITVLDRFDTSKFVVSGIVTEHQVTNEGQLILLKISVGWNAGIPDETNRYFLVPSQVYSEAFEDEAPLILFSDSEKTDDPLIVTFLEYIPAIMSFAQDLPLASRDYNRVDNFYYPGYYFDDNAHYRYVFNWGGVYFQHGWWPWFYDYGLGWLYAAKNTGIGTSWNWHSKLGWIWIYNDFYPILYSDDLGWIYIYRNRANAILWYYSYTDSKWKSLVREDGTF